MLSGQRLWVSIDFHNIKTKQGLPYFIRDPSCFFLLKNMTFLRPGYSHGQSLSLFTVGKLVDEGVRQFAETGESEVCSLFGLFHINVAICLQHYNVEANWGTGCTHIYVLFQRLFSRCSILLPRTKPSSTPSLPPRSSTGLARHPQTSSSTATTVE